MLLAKLSDIPGSEFQTADFFGREVLIFKVDGRPQAFLSFCTHAGEPTKRVEFDGKRLQCPARSEVRLIMLPTAVEDGMLLCVYGEA